MFSRLIKTLRPHTGRTYDADIVERIRHIDWFAKCGQLFPEEFPIALKRVTTWTDAEANSLSHNWEDAELEFRNRLTEFLCSNALPEYQRWNSIAVRAKKDIIGPLEVNIWRPMVRELGLSEKIVTGFRWDLLGALMENAYQDIDGRPTFFLYLLEIYEDGHFPCGWEGSIDPLEGHVLVL